MDRNLAVYFIEIGCERFYKADTFWSKTRKLEFAKVHDDSEYDQTRFYESIVGSIRYSNKEDILKLNGSLYGMSIVKSNNSGQFINGVELVDVVYLKVIKVVKIYPLDEKISDKCDFDVKVESIDYKSYNRDRIIGDILDKK